MIGLIVLVCVLIMLGFMLAWIAGVVAKEEVQVGTGVLILVLTGVLSWVAQFGLNTVMPGSKMWATPMINFALLVLMINLIAKLSWKHAAIIAAIYTGLLFLVTLGLSTCAG